MDTGALIALERDKRRAITLVTTAVELGLPIRVPAAAIAEFWRGEHANDIRELLEATCVADTYQRARRAGEALAGTRTTRPGAPRPSVVDALVAAVAAEHGDRVLTSDPDDLAALSAWFGNLTVLRV